MRVRRASGVRLRNPQATDRQILEDWIHRVLGFPAITAGETVMEEQLSGFQGAREIIRVLDRLGIPYVLGGSMASSIHGEPRSTQASDITVAPFPDKVHR